jgi:hypothetical protein
MTTPDQAGKTKSPSAQGGQDARSDKLLPADSKSGDGRFDVAEEVSLDQQSDTARQVGAAPAGGAADALAESLRDKNSGEGSGPRK